MQNTYKILSLLLDYPGAELHASLPEIIETVDAEGCLDAQQRDALQTFVDYASSLSLEEWQMQYVQLFDFASGGNLYLFDHVYGDSRERGQAMVDLKEMYEHSGLTVSNDELPDYLPLFLEYLSLLPSREDAAELLADVAHIIEQMKEALLKKETPYTYLLDILTSIKQ